MYSQPKASHSKRKQRRKIDSGHNSEEEDEEENDAGEKEEEEEEMLRFRDRRVPSMPETGCHPLLPLENSVRSEDEEAVGEEELRHQQTPDLASSHHYSHSLTPPVEQMIKWKDRKKQVHFAHCN